MSRGLCGYQLYVLVIIRRMIQSHVLTKTEVACMHVNHTAVKISILYYTAFVCSNVVLSLFYEEKPVSPQCPSCNHRPVSGVFCA